MKKIPLTQGRFALVDDTDFEFLNQWRWHFKKSKSTGYAVRKQYLFTKNGKEHYRVIYMARLIMGTPDNLLCDHIDGNGLNNQKTNLRNCTKSQNLQNRGPQSNNSSGHKNVYWHRQDSMWRVFFTRHGKKHEVGLFHDIEDAVAARDKAVFEVNGDFARTEPFNV